MEYILNKSLVKTTNNFKINDFIIDLDIKESDFNDYLINTNQININTSIKNNFNSKIGLKTNKYKNIDVNINKSINKPIIIKYNFNDNDYLSSKINININNNINTDIIILFNSTKEAFLNTKITINSNDNSKSNISIINLLNDESKSFIAIENYLKDKSKSNINFIELGGKVKVSNYYSKLNEKSSENNFNSLYIGKNNDKLDLNYYINNNNKNTISNMNIVGVLKDNSYKAFKGIIDFSKDSKKSIGKELENCILLSDKVISKSLPILLCHEEDVNGSHGVSTGKIDNEQLFYIMSRGISEEDAKKLIINANFNNIINNINDKKIKELIIKK